MAKGNSGVMSMININEQKAIKFYSEIISLYPPEVIGSLWKDRTEFLRSLKGALYQKYDNEYEVDFSKLKIKFSKSIFNILFLNNTEIELDKLVGRRLELNNYIYLELEESPLVNLKNKEDSNLFFLSRRRYYWGFFFINEDKEESLYYPKEVLPIFISQLKARLIKDYFSNVTTSTDIYFNFCALFKPIKYILKVKKGKEALLEKLLYRLCTDLGLTEHKTYSVSKIDISQKIDAIFVKDADREIGTPLLLSARRQYNLDSLRFYLSAMGNLDPIYQFLELYHALESYFYSYLYKYITNLTKVKTKKDFEQIRNATNEREMLGLVIEDISNEFPHIKEGFKKITNFKQFCKNVINMDNIDPNNWDENNTKKFSNIFSDIIYTIRNNIVHTKEADKSIRDLSRGEQNTLIEINQSLLFVARKVFDKNVEW